ncbi:MAG: segregation and condensation protein A [Pseudomonadota bacterium]
MMTELTQEQKILMTMRQVLARVVRDTTSPRGLPHPLTEETIEQMRLCFGLIAARERELAEQQGRTEARPYFSDEVPAATFVPMDAIGRPPQNVIP